MKVGDIFAPKVGTIHFKSYGNFVGKVISVVNGVDQIYWNVLEGGHELFPVQTGRYTNTTHIDELEVITEIYNSPLYQALK